MPRDLNITTADGTCPAQLFTPSTGTGPWPGVIFFIDGLGMRPVLPEMAQKLADAGYAVLMPDAYYRFGPYTPMEPAAVFSDPDKRAKLMEWVATLTRARKVSDTAAYLDTLDRLPEVKGDKYGATGYCMGGHAALIAAGAFPDKFAAIASFHGGNLAVDSPDSPHHFAPAIKAYVYIAGADADVHFDEAQKQRLEQALNDAGVENRVETYEGALHGYTMRDLPVFNPAALERHWAELLKLLDEKLK